MPKGFEGTAVDSRDESGHGASLESVAVFALVAAQVLNSDYTALSEVLTLGKLVTAGFIFLAGYWLTVRNVRFTETGLVLALLITIYVVATALGTMNPRSGQAVRYLFTVAAQWLSFMALLTLWRRRWLWPALWSFMVVAVLLAVINTLNAVVPGIELLQVRESVPRRFMGLRFTTERLVSVTDIYGQFGFFVLLGGFMLADQLRHAVTSRLVRFAAVAGVLAVIGVGVVSTQSRSIMVAYVTALVGYSFLVGGPWIRLALASLVAWIGVRWGALLVQAIVAINVTTVEGRLEHIRTGLSLIPRYPLGLGQGGYQAIAARRTVLHNTFLDAFMISGIAGGLAFLALAAAPVVLLWRYRKRSEVPVAGLLAGYAGGIVVMNFYNGLTEYQYFFLPIIAMGIGQYLSRPRERRGPEHSAVFDYA